MKHGLHLSEELKKPCHLIAKEVSDFGGKAFFVGGCVRDSLLGATPKDIDIEVYGIDSQNLEKLLKKHFFIIQVGKAFGVHKIKGHEIDISIPRKENKAGTGHRGFKIHEDPTLSPAEAALRRDFTVNAIMADVLTGEVLDPFKGVEDLKKKILRHTSDKFFEDPLRVLRAMQFSARFNFQVHPQTIKVCTQITPETLPKERIFDEWAKLLTKGQTPSIGLNFLKQCGWVQYYPELHALIGCEQDPKWHPEGDVWIHTLHALDDFAKNKTGIYWEDLIVGLSVLCHDFGKPSTSYIDENGHIRSPGHDIKGVPLVEKFLKRMTSNRLLIDSVLSLVETHMRPIELFKSQASCSAIRRLAKKVNRMDRLIRLVSADLGGRPPLDKNLHTEELNWFKERVHELDILNCAPKPIILGRHLIAEGLKPNKSFKKIINMCFEAQLDGQFMDLESGIVFLRNYLKENNPNNAI